MHFTKILHVCVILHVVFQGASGAILRGRSGDSDSIQLPASESQLSTRDATPAKDLEDLNRQLDGLLRTLNDGVRKSDSADNTNIAERQTGDIQISQQVLQELLRLIQSIAAQINAIIASSGGSPSGSSPSGTTLVGSPGPLPSNTAFDPAPTVSSPVLPVDPTVGGPTTSNPGPAVSPPVPSVDPTVGSPPASSSGPVASSPAQSGNPPATTPDGPDVGPLIPTPFLTSPGAGTPEPPTTVYGTATLTGTRCKTTLTQTFTSYVYEDGSPAMSPVARSVDDGDNSENPELHASEEEPEVDDLESRAEFDETTMPDGPFDWDPSVPESWTTLKATRRESRRSPDRANFLFFRDEEDVLEVFPS